MGFLCLPWSWNPSSWAPPKNNPPRGGHAGSFGGTTVSSACRVAELPCGFARWWLNHKNTGTEGCTPQGLWDSSAFSGRTAALSKWRCRSRSEDSEDLEGRRHRVGQRELQEEAGGGWGVDEGQGKATRTGIWGQIAVGITENGLVFLWLELVLYQADTFRWFNVSVLSESRSNN